MPLTVAAHAKLNLTLSVGPPQPPKGYHPICSWFTPITLHDSLTIERLPPGSNPSLEIGWAPDAPRPSPVDWPIDRDLAFRALRLLEAHTGRALPARLALAKRIPVGGGLGGGSSDAAAALIGLNKLFDLNLDPPALRALASTLGSDIAFFIDDDPAAETPRPAIVSGFGESIRRVACVPASVVLICPPFGCTTAAVYQAFDRLIADPGGTEILSDPEWVHLQVEHAEQAGAIADDELFNDLAHAACEVAPQLGDLLGEIDLAVSKLKARVHLTGSGSTMFCIVPAGTEPAAVAGVISAAAPGCAVIPAATL